MYWLGVIGCWLLSDSILSWTLYLNAPSYDGVRRQTFKRDHWIRLIRGVLGVALIYMGAQ